MPDDNYQGLPIVFTIYLYDKQPISRRATLVLTYLALYLVYPIVAVLKGIVCRQGSPIEVDFPWRIHYPMNHRSPSMAIPGQGAEIRFLFS